jgi:ribosome-binding protein aMBF1 (putative translation factor)
MNLYIINIIYKMSNNTNGEWTTVDSKKKTHSKNGSQESSNNIEQHYEHQNWSSTVIHGKSSKPGPTQTKKTYSEEAIRLAKIENDEPVKQRILTIEARQELIKGRVAKGLNQEKLANALCIPANLYKDYENGKTIPAPNILSKINNFLGTKVKLT